MFSGIIYFLADDQVLKNNHDCLIKLFPHVTKKSGQNVNILRAVFKIFKELSGVQIFLRSESGSLRE